VPYHLSENKLSVLDESGKVVPSGTYKNSKDALARLQAMNINVRRAEGKPVAPKPDEKASWLADPTDEDIYQFLVNEGMDQYLPNYFKQQDFNPGNGIDRASYHPVDERFQYLPAPDWNDDTAIAAPEVTLPDVWVRAHPFGSETQKDAHGEYFDKQTDFHEKDIPLPNLPVTYYHNFNPDGTPKDKPTVIGKSIARKYQSDGRWDKLHFYSDKMEPDIKRRIVKAIRTKSLRASPTVIPDIHSVDDGSGHINDWATGSIAVLDAAGERQPANQLAIGIPQMKALFKAAQIPFPKNLGGSNMGNSTRKAAPSWKARVLKSVIKALGETEENGMHSHPDGSQHANHLGYEQAHEHDENGAMKALETEGQNLVDDASQRARFEGADLEHVEKDVNPLPELAELLEQLGEATEQGNELKDPDVKLDWKPETKRMKAIIGAQANQLKALQTRADNGDFDSWVSQQLVAGKVLPAEVNDLRMDFMQAVADDRAIHPVMKSQDGKTIVRVQRLKANVERRASRFGEMDLTGEQMKALGLQMGSSNFDQTKSEKPFTPERRAELMNASAVGAKLLQDEKKK
jgi:hypothetical protein